MADRRPRQGGASARAKTSAGARTPRTFRGRRLSRSSTARICAGVTWRKSVPFEQYSHTKPLGGSFRPRFQDMVGGGEIEAHAQYCGDLLVSRELLAVVRHAGVDAVSGRPHAPGDRRLGRSRHLPLHPLQKPELRAPVHRQRVTASLGIRSETVPEAPRLPQGLLALRQTGCPASRVRPLYPDRRCTT